jgi:hypothetical protein
MNIHVKGCKIVKTATAKDNSMSWFEGTHPVARIHFCNWFLWSTHNGPVDLQLVSFFLMMSHFLYVGGEFSEQSDLEC